jgi:hypothetical protein
VGPYRVSGNRSRANSVSVIARTQLAILVVAYPDLFLRSSALLGTPARSFLFLRGGEALRLFSTNHSLVSAMRWRRTDRSEVGRKGGQNGLSRAIFSAYSTRVNAGIAQLVRAADL